jgi:hypothetical protein
VENANLVAYSDLWQVLGIFAGIWFAYFSLVISLLVGWYIRDTNRRDKDIDRRFRELEADIDRRFREMEEANERRHQELLKAIGLLYHHVHDDDGKAIIPLPDIELVAPAPADN